MKGGAVVLVGLLAAGCAGAIPHQLGAGPSYQVGELEILVFPERERVEAVCRMFDLQQQAPRHRRIHGCYIAPLRRIVTTEDVYVLIHELKHAAEGDWHATTPAPPSP